MNIFKHMKITTTFLTFMSLTPAYATDMLTVKNIGMELARDIASETVLACRGMGYQVSAVVVDRNGITRATLRDDLASRFTLQIAEEKANMVMMSGMNSGEFKKLREDIRQELNHINGIIVMRGGIPINAGGHRIGAVGVSGAPGGDLDEKCAVIALEKFEERIEFAE
ncbi:MAG: heme-binding protein [Gammaproteobacteria bacterium]|nr:heme-binding protein [Gammaproteobacteria bacterium]